jgi:hypothetical protein
VIQDTAEFNERFFRAVKDHVTELISPGCRTRGLGFFGIWVAEYFISSLLMWPRISEKGGPT